MVISFEKKKEVSITLVGNFPWVVAVVLRFLVRDIQQFHS